MISLSNETTSYMNRMMTYRYTNDVYSIFPPTIYQRYLAHGEVGVLKSPGRYLTRTHNNNWGTVITGKYPNRYMVSVDGVSPGLLLMKIFYICGMFNIKQIWWGSMPEIQSFGDKFFTKCMCSFILEGASG